MKWNDMQGDPVMRIAILETMIAKLVEGIDDLPGDPYSHFGDRLWKDALEVAESTK